MASPLRERLEANLIAQRHWRISASVHDVKSLIRVTALRRALFIGGIIAWNDVAIRLGSIER
jgi:hypothetical protein